MPFLPRKRLLDSCENVLFRNKPFLLADICNPRDRRLPSRSRMNCCLCCTVYLAEPLTPCDRAKLELTFSELSQAFLRHYHQRIYGITPELSPVPSRVHMAHVHRSVYRLATGQKVSSFQGFFYTFVFPPLSLLSRGSGSVRKCVCIAMFYSWLPSLAKLRTVVEGWSP